MDDDEIVEDQEFEDVEPFSEMSRARLSEQAAAMLTAVQAHTAGLLELRGGASELGRVRELHEAVKEAVAAWDAAVADHTGMAAVGVYLDDDFDDDFDDEDGDDSSDAGREAPGRLLSVVSRCDLEVVDPSALVEAGRAAYRRMWPRETEEDAAVEIGDQHLAQALYQLVHEVGEPWWDIPGVEVLSGGREYIAPEPDLIDTQDPHQAEEVDNEVDDGVGDFDEVVRLDVPNGELLFGESW